MNFHIENEINEIPKILRKRRDVSLKEFSSIIEEPLLITGMGSSLSLPAWSLEKLDELNHLNLKIRYATEISKVNTNTLIALSSSGETKETVYALKNAKSKNKFSITRSRESSLVKHSTHFIPMICGEEKAIPATKAVVEQAYILNQIFLEKIGKYLPITDDEIRQIEENINLNFDYSIIKKFANANRIVVVGERGLASEVALKFKEIARIPTEYDIGTQILHGSFITLRKEDIVLIVNPEMLVGYESLVKEKIKSDIFSTDDLGIKGDGLYADIIRFSGLLNFICKIGKEKKLDLDNPEGLSKVTTKIESFQ